MANDFRLDLFSLNHHNFTSVQQTATKSKTGANMRATPPEHTTGNGSRIPASLQAVFLASNRGHEVNRPPPRNAAFKVFKRRGFGGLFPFKSSRSLNTTKDASQLKTVQVLPQFQKNVSLQTSIPELACVGVPQKTESNRVNSLHQQASAPQPQQTPQSYLDKELSAQGYSVQRYTTMNEIGEANLRPKRRKHSC